MVVYPETNKKGTNKTWISTNTTCWKNFLCFPVLRPLCGRGQPAVFPRVCHGRPVLSHGYLPTDRPPLHPFSRTPQQVSCQALSLPVVWSSATWRLFSTHFITEPFHCQTTCCDFSWGCVSPRTRRQDKLSLCVRARGITVSSEL